MLQFVVFFFIHYKHCTYSKQQSRQCDRPRLTAILTVKLSISSVLGLQQSLHQANRPVICASADEFPCRFVLLLLLPQTPIWLSWFQEP